MASVGLGEKRGRSASDLDLANEAPLVQVDERPTESFGRPGGSKQNRIGSESEGGANAEVWLKTLERVVPCCVVLKVTSTRAFDTCSAGSSFATGFVVDCKRGIILTNRHVIKTGPVTTEAIFLNREEVPVYPLYRDPVHDFGFFRFDPSKIKFMKLREVPLAPKQARVGIEIRVVGNDSGEKISILAGTLARLDRDAPFYSSKGFNDFNTFYLQAASGTKGGSSGSPVINCHGQAVGLNAGSKTKTSSAFFLPLDRVVRAFQFCQGVCPSGAACGDTNAAPASEWRSPHIPRGDLQATFAFKGFEEVRRLGLGPEIESRVRMYQSGLQGSTPATDTPDDGSSGCVGMLVVESRLPGGPSEDKLEPGDVLLEVNGEVLTHFVDLERILDDNVGACVALAVVRGGEVIRHDVKVQDLHAVTPDRFLEVSGGSVHSLSYQQARNNNTHVGQVYVADPGYMLTRAGIPKHACLLSVNNEETPDMEAFARALSTIPHGKQVPVQYVVFSDRHRKRHTLMHMERRWYGPPTMWQRDDARGCWHRVKVYTQEPGEEEGRAGEAILSAEEGVASVEVDAAGEQSENCEAQDIADKVSRSLVLVDTEIPAVSLADGVHAKSFVGNGLVVHHDDEVGLVVVDRNTVPIGACDVRLSFSASPAEVDAKVRFLHPTDNFAVVSYDPKSMPHEARRAVRSCLITTEPPLARGSKVVLVGLSRALRLTAKDAVVTNGASSINIHSAEVPRFHAMNEEVVQVDQDFGSSFSGVLMDETGAVRALWGSFAKQVRGEEREFCAGIHSYTFADWVPKVRAFITASSKHPDAERMDSIPVPIMDVTLSPLLLSKAANYGLPRDWIKRLAEFDTERKQVLKVKGCTAGSSTQSVLREGDMILAVAGKTVTSFRDIKCRVDEHCNVFEGEEDFVTAEQLNNLGNISLTVFRDKKIQDVSLRLDVVDGLGTGRLIHWAGTQLQDSYRAVKELGFLPPQHGVYISRWHHGSPAHRYGLYALHWITEVNGKPMPDLDTFLKEVSTLEHESFVRVKVRHLHDKPKVITLRLDLRFWPTWELTVNHSTGEWQRKVLQLTP